MIRYAEANECRMSALVRHFGDLADGQKACGICDFCAPAQCAAQQFRTASDLEQKAVFRVAEELRSGGMRATGRLHSELYPHGEMTRDTFEEVLGGMARAGLVRLTDAAFEKDGKTIPYRKVSLTRAGHEVCETTPVDFVMKETGKPSRSKRRKKAASARPVPERRTAAEEPDSRIEKALRAWRLEEASGVEAFLAFPNPDGQGTPLDRSQPPCDVRTDAGDSGHRAQYHRKIWSSDPSDCESGIVCTKKASPILTREV